MDTSDLIAISSRSNRALVCCVLLLSLALGASVTFPRLGSDRFDTDESRYALVVDNLLRTGDPWTMSVYPPQPYLNKPPLYMWLTAATHRWLPGLEFKYRFWAAVFGTIAIGLTGLLGAKLFRPEVGLLAAAILAANHSFLFYHGIRFGVMEAGLTAFFVAILSVYWIGREARWGAWRLGRADQLWSQSPAILPSSGLVNPLLSDRRLPISIVTVNADSLLRTRWIAGGEDQPNSISVVSRGILTHPITTVLRLPTPVMFEADVTLRITPNLTQATRVTISMQPPAGQRARTMNWHVTSEDDQSDALKVPFTGPMVLDFPLNRRSTEKHPNRTVKIRLVPADGSAERIGAEVTEIMTQVLPEMVPGRDGRDAK